LLVRLPLQAAAISRITATPAVELGTVTAPDAETAIKKAIKECDIPVAHCDVRGFTHRRRSLR
jgi:hypothetical protein